MELNEDLCNYTGLTRPQLANGFKTNVSCIFTYRSRFNSVLTSQLTNYLFLQIFVNTTIILINTFISQWMKNMCLKFSENNRIFHSENQLRWGKNLK